MSPRLSTAATLVRPCFHTRAPTLFLHLALTLNITPDARHQNFACNEQQIRQTSHYMLYRILKLIHCVSSHKLNTQP